MRLTREEAADMADAHAEGLHDELPREGCPECEGRPLRDYPPAPRFTVGARVRAVHFTLDEGLRIWPIQSGEHDGKWRLVRVAGQTFEEVAGVEYDNLHVLQAKHPDATPGINDNESVPPGTLGTVDHVSGINLFVRWDNGRVLGVTERDRVELV